MTSVVIGRISELKINESAPKFSAQYILLKNFLSLSISADPELASVSQHHGLHEREACPLGGRSGVHCQQHRHNQVRRKDLRN